MLDAIRDIENPATFLQLNLLFTIVLLILSYLVRDKLKIAAKGLFYFFTNTEKFKVEIAKKYSTGYYIFCTVVFFILSHVALNIIFVYISLLLWGMHDNSI